MLDQLQNKSSNENDDSLNLASLSSLQHEIDLHRQHEQQQSYLARAITTFSSWLGNGKDSSATSLEHLLKQSQTSLKSVDPATASKLRQDIHNAIEKDRQFLANQEQINQYATSFFKTAGLFMRGKFGLTTTVAAYTLDKMNPADPMATQLTNLGLGAIEAGLLRKTYDVLGAKSVSIAAKGTGLGITSRLLELGLNRKSYLAEDTHTGNFSFESGLRNTLTGALNHNALLLDVAIFGLAHNMHATINSTTGSLLERSPLTSTVLTGTTFGFSSGASQELLRQMHTGSSLDVRSIIKHGLIQGALDTIAAAPGGLQGDVHSRRLVHNLYKATTNNFKQATKLLEGSLAATLPLLAGPKLVTELESASLSEPTTAFSLGMQSNRSGFWSKLLNTTGLRADRAHNPKSKELPLQEVGLAEEEIIIPRAVIGEEQAEGVSFESYQSYIGSNRAYIFVSLKVLKLPGIDTKLRIPDGSALYPRTSAEEIGKIIMDLPEPSLIKTLTVSDHRHVDEPWIIHLTGNEDIRVKGETDRQGNVTIFQPKDREKVRLTIAHEFAHIMKEKFPRESDAFDKAIEISPLLLITESRHAYSNSHEMYARLGEELIGGDQTNALMTAQLNPIASVLLARGISRLVSSGHNSTSKQQYRALCDYIDQHIRPKAILELDAAEKEGIDPYVIEEIRCLVQIPLSHKPK